VFRISLRYYWVVLTVRIESVFYFLEESLSRHEIVSIEISSEACGNMFPVILIEPPFQHPQDILLLQEKPTLKVAKSTVDSERVTAVLECG
jgi:hypothetical protein